MKTIVIRLSVSSSCRRECLLKNIREQILYLALKLLKTRGQIKCLLTCRLACSARLSARNNCLLLNHHTSYV